MTTFKEIQGRNIRSYTTNPDNPLEGQMWYNQTDYALKGVVATAAWSSASPLTTAREGSAAFGAQTTAVICGGETPSVSGATEEYNGSGFSAGGDMNTARFRQGAAGISTAGIIFGGYIATNTNATEEYDGSSWTTSPGSLNTARNALAGAGIQTSALAFGGTTVPNFLNSTEEYNGTSWTAVNNLNTGRRSIMGSGANAEECLAFGGEVSSPPAVATANTESWNGTSWTEVNNLNTARYGGYGAGTQTAAILAGGIVGPGTMQSATETWDGTNWTTSPVSLATARGRLSVAGTQTAAIAMSGQTPSITTATEEYNFSTNIITPGAFAASGTMGTARSQISGFGASTNASIGAGGYQYGPNAYTNASEEYNGATFSSTPNMPVSLGFRNSGGTVAAGIVFAGHDNTSPTNTSLWDGSNYSNGPNLNNGGYGTMGNGSQTAAFIAGSSEPPSRPNTATEEYNGSSWSTVPGALNTGRGNGMGVGSQTAGLAIGGASPNPVENLMEEYNGSTWTVGHTLVVGVSRSSAQGGSAPQDNTMIAGGGSSAIATAQQYNGTAWATAPSLATARQQNGMGAGSDSSSMIVAGGNNPSINTSEEFTGETTALNIVDITTS